MNKGQKMNGIQRDRKWRMALPSDFLRLYLSGSGRNIQCRGNGRFVNV